jgi:hypothetical protein
MTMNQTPAALLADLKVKFEKRISDIKARPVPRMNYVLMWPDCRFIGFPTSNTDPQVVGFERAAFFGDREAARVWLRRGLTDQTGAAPEIVSAFNAQQAAVIEVEKALKVVTDAEEQA